MRYGPVRYYAWTSAEDLMVQVYYPTKGKDWPGWTEVLPRRTYRAIKARAEKLKAFKEKAAPAGKPKPKKRGNFVPVKVERTPDPYEKWVLERMERGMTPSEIDREMRGKWAAGTTRAILVERWKREMDAEEGSASTRGFS